MNDDMANIPVNKVNILHYIEQGWNDFQAFLDTLSPVQLTGPTDAVGWTVKDHLIHLATWEDGITALLDRQPRFEGMSLDKALWDGGTEVMNAAVQRRYRDLPLEEVRQRCKRSHEQLVGKIRAMTDEDLLRPYSYFQPDSDREDPVWGWIVGNTFMHYAEHKPWITAIVSG